MRVNTNEATDRLRGPALNRAVAFLVIAAGGGCSAAWVIHASVPLVWRQAQAFDWWLAPAAVALTGANLALRFLRWQFFLRRAGVFLPVRQSAGIFVAGLAMLLTPAYAGEGVKTWLVRRAQAGSTGAPRSPRRPQVPRPGRATARAAGVVLAERLFDALALTLLGGAALLWTGERTLGAALFGAGIGALALLGAAAVAVQARSSIVASDERRKTKVDGVSSSVFRLSSFVRTAAEAGSTLCVALALSALAWLAGTCTLVAVCAGAGCSVGPAQAAGTYAAATLLGGVTLLPAGVGVVGTAILLRLEGYGVPEQTAVLAAVLVRLFTVWLTAAMGVIGCWRLAYRAGAVPLGPTLGERERFDALAPVYADQLSPAARERVVQRKVALMGDALAAAGISPGARLLDAGCGQGWYVGALAQRGFDVTGVDLSPGQVRQARDQVRGAGRGRLAAASLLDLPFHVGAFDAAYAINVLHHLGGAAEQRRALDELSRTVRPGGLVFVHEISTVNPLYRLYMSYVFPLLRRIDLGTERWLDPRRPPRSTRLMLQEVRCYTFWPDFMPRWLFNRLAGVEAWLERSPLAGYGAHFTAVYARRPDYVLPPAESNAASPRELVAAG